jgi:NAD(P)H-dependent flavin oxidoreductase YrpB (nitropropane dioxygenase family)
MDISKQRFPFTGNWLTVPPASDSDGFPPGVSNGTFLVVPGFPAANFSSREEKCWKSVQLIMSQPKIIQGGMGVAVSGWTLARTVSKLGQLGVVSGTGLAIILARSLQLGDPSGQLRHALQRFPIPDVAGRVLARYFIPGGKSPSASFKLAAMPTLRPGPALLELTVLANFVEVFLAKDGHGGLVGINYLEKIQLPTLPSLYGAMLADVDYVLMGAGIPRAIPGALDRLAQGEPAQLKIDVIGAQPGEAFLSTFDPRAFFNGKPPVLKRPQFLGIVASVTLAMTLARKASGHVDGFVIEGDTAGGHNAPPRGTLQLNAIGEPIYGERDVVDLKKIHDLGRPFWLAGSYGRPGRLAEALRLGASGVQVGTAFAFCNESGLRPELKRQALQMSRVGNARVFTDPVASPTGFPFKVVQMPGTLSEVSHYVARTRVCDLGYLRHLYRKPDGTLGYRCPAEPVEDYVKKGGALADTQGRKCLCNGLVANIGLSQVRSEMEQELAFMTAGDNVAQVAQFLKPGCDSYSAVDILRRLLAGQDTEMAALEKAALAIPS